MAFYSQIVKVTIANGANVSSVFGLSSLALCGVFGNSALDGATLTFEVSPDAGTTWQILDDTTGAAVSITVTANEARQISPSKVVGWPHIRVKTASNQTAARLIQLLAREV